jgi:hypothetical protein
MSVASPAAAPGLSPFIDRLWFVLDVKVNSFGVDISIDKELC